MVVGKEEEEKEEELVTPGEVLGKASLLIPGRGAYVAPHNQTIYASLTGRRHLIPPPSHSPNQRATVEVVGHKAHGAVPEPGSVVIARITKVMARMASADIMCVGPKSVREKFTGTIRQQDVRASEIDKVDMHLSFRPGDIVRALVVDFVNLIDRCQYLLPGTKTYICEVEWYDGIVRGWRFHLTCPCMDPNGGEGEILAAGTISRLLASKQAQLSLGDARAYFLSTAKNELGVVSAESIAGATMVPISWTEMQCPLTGQIEKRKVAKAS